MWHRSQAVIESSAYDSFQENLTPSRGYVSYYNGSVLALKLCICTNCGEQNGLKKKWWNEFTFYGTRP